jgi:hypothetical protein
MSIQSNAYKPETVVPFGPDRGASDIDQLDRAGETILTLLHRAAGAAEQNSKQALEMAQALSQQLREAEQQIVELQANIRYQEDRADRAEQWLHKIYTEIDDRFVRQTPAGHGATGAPQSPRRRIQPVS